jgi:RNA polymerase sigma factor (sigma-70 family)
VTEAEADMLVKGCIGWDRNSQTMLYRHFSAKMFAVCYRYSRSREEAEDTLQEAFVKVFENLKHFKKEGSLEGWIRRIMVNTAIQKYRKHANRLPDVSIDSESIHHSYAESATSELSARELIAMVQKLPPKCRLVFNLYVMEGFNHREIAAQLGISEGTSKSNLHDARAALQKALHKLNALELVQKH